MIRCERWPSSGSTPTGYHPSSRRHTADRSGNGERRSEGEWRVLELTVYAGDLKRVSPLVAAHLPAAQLAPAGMAGALGGGPLGEQTEGGACLLRALDRAAGKAGNARNAGERIAAQ